MKRLKAGSSKNYRYYFSTEYRNDETHLVCNIVASDTNVLNTKVATSLIATLRVLNVISLCEATVETVGNRLKVFLKKVDSEKAFNAMLTFVERLQDLGICETHENRKAMWFYTSNGGDQILNTHNFPDELNRYLQNEAEKAYEIISSNLGYTKLIEAGCGKMVNLPLARRANLQYHGIDISQVDVQENQEQITRNSTKYVGVSVQLMNLLNINRDVLLLTDDEKPIILMPFNLFGNIAPIALLLARLKLSNIDVMISFYKTDTKTNEMRKSYYGNCGYKNIITAVDETGTTFTSEEGLHTIAYHPNYLKKILEKFGFETMLHETGEYGYILHAKSIPFALSHQLDESKKLNLRSSAMPSSVVVSPQHNNDFILKLCSASMFLYSLYLVISEIYEDKPIGKVESMTVVLGAGILLSKLGFMAKKTNKEHPNLTFDSAHSLSQ